jgi:hypothetical protein
MLSYSTIHINIGVGEEPAMKTIQYVSVAILALSGAVTTSLHGQTVAPVQSPARPLGLPVHGPVMQFSSDARSTDFYVNYMPAFMEIINSQLAESVVFHGVSGFKLDASRLILRSPSDRTIRIYFLAEGAGYHNTVGFAWTPAGSPGRGAATVLFPDASIRSGSTRTTWEPLKRGDFIEIGVGERGYQLDFFLISDAVNGGTQWLWNDPNENSDRLQHVVAFLLPGTPYILLGFEDIIGGGDRDYNDALFVVDIGMTNADNLDQDDESTLPN